MNNEYNHNLKRVRGRMPRLPVLGCSWHQIGPIKKLIFLLLLITFLKGLLLALVTPMWQAPDEPTHTGYIETIVTEHRFPKPTDLLSANIHRSLKETNFWPELVRATGWNGAPKLWNSAAAHPPLYYLLGAPFFYVFTPLGLKWQLFVLRLLGVLATVGIVWLGFKTADLLFPKNTFIKIILPSFIASQPQFSFVMAGVNNDALANLLFAATFYALLVIIIRGFTWQRAVASGLLIGLGITTKESFPLMIPLALLAFVISTLLTKNFRESLKSVAVWTGTVFVSTSWLLLWNYDSYRNLFTSAVRSSATIQGWKVFLSLAYLKTYFVEKIAHEFWGDFGWLAIPMSQSIYRILIILVELSLLGLLIWAFQSYGSQIAVVVEQWRRSARAPNPGVPVKEAFDPKLLLGLLFLMLGVGVTVLAIMRFELLGMGSQGRYLFTAIIPIFLFLSLGLSALFPTKIHRYVIPAIFLGLFAFSMISLFGYIIPHYFAV